MLHRFLLITLLIFGCVFTTNAFLFSDRVQKVDTKYGEIIGRMENVNFDGKPSQVAKFLGIPFAEPPVGDLRLQKPVPLRNLSTPFRANSFGPACIQEETTFAPGVTYSEDCLYLNIFVPLHVGQSGISPKPVMIWIHGGGFVEGSAHYYDGGVLSTFTDVIVVTVQYRLGPVGFFSTHDDHAKGNYGVWDQHMAIKWVRDNIDSFGGDTNNITIFGESAGSSSVVYQTMYQGNDGLFKRAIAESGSVSAWAITSKEANYNASITFANALGCDLATHGKVIQCIRMKSSAEVKAAAAQLLTITTDIGTVKWAPVYDGEFVTTEPEQMLDQASVPQMASEFTSFRNKDLLIGANNYDGGVIVMSVLGINSFDLNITINDLKTKYIPKLIRYMHHQNATSVSVDAILDEYKDYTGKTSTMQSLLRMSTDAALYAPTVKTCRAHRMGNRSTYLYQFSVTPPLRYIPLPSYTDGDPAAANHADELMYVFGFDPLLYQAYKSFNASRITATDIQVSKLVMAAWSNFARTGNPNLPMSLRSMAGVLWKSFGDDENYLEITPDTNDNSLKRRVAARGVAFWNDLLPNLLKLGPPISS